jgi:hypothetical protein
MHGFVCLLNRFWLEPVTSSIETRPVLLDGRSPYWYTRRGFSPTRCPLLWERATCAFATAELVIHGHSIVGADNGEGRMPVSCGKGTYIPFQPAAWGGGLSSRADRPAAGYQTQPSCSFASQPSTVGLSVMLSSRYPRPLVGQPSKSRHTR